MQKKTKATKGAKKANGRPASKKRMQPDTTAAVYSSAERGLPASRSILPSLTLLRLLRRINGRIRREIPDMGKSSRTDQLFLSLRLLKYRSIARRFLPPGVGKRAVSRR
jgi:hypothetical protein